MGPSETEVDDYLGQLCAELRVLAVSAKRPMLAHILAMAELECRQSDGSSFGKVMDFQAGQRSRLHKFR
jgi:hypothetical protein